MIAFITKVPKHIKQIRSDLLCGLIELIITKTTSESFWTFNMKKALVYLMPDIILLFCMCVFTQLCSGCKDYRELKKNRHMYSSNMCTHFILSQRINVTGHQTDVFRSLVLLYVIISWIDDHEIQNHQIVLTWNLNNSETQKNSKMVLWSTSLLNWCQEFWYPL